MEPVIAESNCHDVGLIEEDNIGFNPDNHSGSSMLLKVGTLLSSNCFGIQLLYKISRNTHKICRIPANLTV